MLARFSLSLISFYQHHFSKYVGGHCVFIPSCSEYAKIAIGNNGFIYGWFQTLSRILRCKQPNGGIDYPKIKIKQKT